MDVCILPISLFKKKHMLWSHEMMGYVNGGASLLVRIAILPVVDIYFLIIKLIYESMWNENEIDPPFGYIRIEMTYGKIRFSLWHASIEIEFYE